MLDSDALQANYSGTEGLLSFLKRLASRNLFHYLPAYFTSGRDLPCDSLPTDSSFLGMTVRNSIFLKNCFCRAFIFRLEQAFS